MIALRYGTLPIVRETGGLRDSIRDAGAPGGNGFTFQTYDSGDMKDAVHRAVAMYGDPERRKALIYDAMHCDFSWGQSANAYIRLYRQMLKGE